MYKYGFKMYTTFRDIEKHARKRLSEKFKDHDVIAKHVNFNPIDESIEITCALVPINEETRLLEDNNKDIYIDNDIVKADIKNDCRRYKLDLEDL